MSRISMSLVLPLAALFLSACAPMPAAPPPLAGTCNAEAAHWAIGRAATPEVVDRVVHETRSRAVRVIHPGQAVTMDYNPSRVNIHVNERNAINSITCG